MLFSFVISVVVMVVTTVFTFSLMKTTTASGVGVIQLLDSDTNRLTMTNL